MAEIENVKVLEVDTTKSINSVRDLRKAMKELDNQFLQGKLTEEQYAKATEQLEQTMLGVTDTHKDAKLAIADFGVQMKNVMTIGKSLSAGLTGIQAGMNALGIESAGVAEQISKLQNLQALTQAFGALKYDGVKAFKGLTTALKGSTAGMNGFKKALIGTGIGALVVILGSIIANWDEFTKAIGVSEEAMNKFGNVFSGVINVIKQGTAGIAKAFAKVFTGDFSGALDELKNGFDVVANYNDGVQQKIEEREAEATEKLKEENDKRKQTAENALKEYEARKNAELELDKAKNADSWQQTQEYKERMQTYYNDLLKQYALVYGKDSVEYKQQLAKKLEFLKGFLTDEEIAEQERQQREAEANEKLLQDRETLLKRLTEFEKGEQQTELDNLKAQYDQELLLLAENEEAKLLLKEEYNQKVAEINEKYREKDVEETKATEDEKIGIWKNATEESVENANTQVKNTSSLASSVTSILDSFADAQDETSKAGFEKAKKVQVATAIIQMLQGIATAISGAYTTKTGPWDIALAAAQATAIGVSSGVQIAKIKQQTYDGGSGTTSVPNVNVSASSALNNPALNTRSILGDSESEALQKDTKVYVTESDIKTTTAKVTVQESENTI